MIRVEVIEQFNFKDYDKIKDTIKRKSIDAKGTLFIGDTFGCDEEMANYLMGDNKDKQVVVKVIEVEPEIKIEQNKIELNASNITITDKDNKKINIKKKKSSKK